MLSLFGLLGPAAIVVVSGVARSGTTVLQHVVSTAAGANGLVPEFLNLQQVMQVAEVARSLNLHMKCLKPEFLREELQWQLRAFWRAHGQPKLLLVKDPLLTDAIAGFVEVMPDVKNVISLRDPRDTAYSILTVRKKMMADPSHGASFITNMDERGIVDYVLQRSREILAVANRPNVYVARYERLVNLDQSFRRELSDFIGKEVTFDTTDATSAFDPKNPFHTDVLGRKPTASRIGRYAEMPESLLEEFEKHRDLLAELGYAPDTPKCGRGEPKND